MIKQILQWSLVGILCLPLVRVSLDALHREETIDYQGAAWKARESLISRARVLVSQPPLIARLDLSRPPGDPDPLPMDEPLECRYVPKPPKATTPKFECELPNGQTIKVKYGPTPEKSGEVAASRLLAALGFGADLVTMVPRLRCHGCPWRPFQMQKIAEFFFAAPVLNRLSAGLSPEFEWVSVERKMAGREIKVGSHEGWDWRELPLVDPRKGGAARAELDALRLIAIFLGHWDNKATNQRLVCEEGPGDDDPQAPCRHPLLMLQDVGATFGPTKVEHDEWSARPIWSDPATCTVSLQSLPYHGGDFTPTRISEAGRVLLGERLAQLSEAQIRSLFESARFPDPATGDIPGDVTPWVRTFQGKVRQIVNRQPCPSTTD